MFASPESFAAFFFTCMALVILGIVFEDKLIALEDKHTQRKSKHKNKE